MNPSTEPLNNEIPQEGLFIPGQNHYLNIVGFMRTLEEVPTYTPRLFNQQFAIVTNGGSSRAYVYDTLGRAWRFAPLS